MFHRNYFEQNSRNFIFSSKCNIMGTLILAKPIFMMHHMLHASSTRDIDKDRVRPYLLKHCLSQCIYDVNDVFVQEVIF